MMEIDENLKDLSVKLTALKHITDGLYNNLDKKIYPWLQDVERIAGDRYAMEAQLYNLRRPHASNNQIGRMELDNKLIEEFNMKVIQSLKLVQASKEVAFETLLLQVTEDKLKRYSHDDLIMFTSRFSVEIGSGGFSNVYQGTLSDGVRVAVKVLKQDDKAKDVVQDIFVIELCTMIKASHPNLIKLYGFCFDDNMKALVYEYMENGSLDKVLFKKQIVVGWQGLYEIAINTAKVLAYLHHDCDDQIIHHDIKPANILLDSNLSPKVTDFGVAKIMNRDTTHFTMTRIRGTFCYIAPEMAMQASRVTYTCDVYSFGMTLFDILGMRINTKTQPLFPNHIWQKFDKGKLDDIMKECEILEEDAESARVLCMVAIWCIQFTPELRPSMKDVVNALKNNLQVASPPNPFLAWNKHFSMKQSQDVTYSVASNPSLDSDESVAPNPSMPSNEHFPVRQPQELTYSVASTSTHQSHPQENSVINELPDWDAESSGTEYVEGSPAIRPEESPEIRPSLENEGYHDFQSPPRQNSTMKTLKEWGKNLLKRNWLKQVSQEDQPPVTMLKQFSHEDLKRFTKNFSTQVHSDGNLKTYKGQFTNGVQILVKVESYSDSNWNHLLEAEIKVLSVISHRNIIKPLGFCFSQSMKALVLEYMENGSLGDILFGYPPRNIEWKMLYRIATETAKGISYLHDGCDEVIIHTDIKPYNILLDSSLSPKLWSFYQTRQVDRNLTHLMVTRIAGTWGYMDPHYMMIGYLSYTNDVYSFGITLFDIFGSQKTDGYTSVDDFVRECWEKYEKGEMEEFLRERGFTEGNREDATLLLMVAFWCIQYTAEARPNMRTVVMMLEKDKQVPQPPKPFDPFAFSSDSSDSE